VLAEPAPKVRLASFDDSAITYEIQVWSRAKGVSQLDLRSALLSQIWYALRRQGQSIPFPVRQLEPRREKSMEDLDTPLSPQIGTRALRSNRLFGGLNEAQQAALVEASQTLCFGPGEVIVREGAEGDSLYIVLFGGVEVSKEVDGRQLVVRQLGKSDVFGEMTLFLDTPRSATVRALDECRLLRVDRPTVQTLFRDDPALLERFATLVAARQAELKNLSLEEGQEESSGLLTVMKRLFSVLAAG
jgi:CRP-like cAMP-binding protein